MILLEPEAYMAEYFEQKSIYSLVTWSDEVLNCPSAHNTIAPYKEKIPTLLMALKNAPWDKSKQLAGVSINGKIKYFSSWYFKLLPESEPLAKVPALELPSEIPLKSLPAVCTHSEISEHFPKRSAEPVQIEPKKMPKRKKICLEFSEKELSPRLVLDPFPRKKNDIGIKAFLTEKEDDLNELNEAVEFIRSEHAKGRCRADESVLLELVPGIIMRAYGEYKGWNFIDTRPKSKCKKFAFPTITFLEKIDGLETTLWLEESYDDYQMESETCGSGTITTLAIRISQEEFRLIERVADVLIQGQNYGIIIGDSALLTVTIPEITVKALNILRNKVRTK